MQTANPDNEPKIDLPPSSELDRGLGPWQATGLNIANMIGIGPFVTIPLFIAAMSGPQAMIAWVLAASKPHQATNDNTRRPHC